MEVDPQLKMLAAGITEAGIKTVYNNRETVAQYNAPFQLFDRHNEVWIDIDGESVPQNC